MLTGAPWPHLPEQERRRIDTERDSSTTALGATQSRDDASLERGEQGGHNEAEREHPYHPGSIGAILE